MGLSAGVSVNWLLVWGAAPEATDASSTQESKRNERMARVDGVLGGRFVFYCRKTRLYCYGRVYRLSNNC